MRKKRNWAQDEQEGNGPISCVPRRSDLVSKFNSVASITYVSLDSKGLHELNETEEEEVYDPLTCVASPQVKRRHVGRIY